MLGFCLGPQGWICRNVRSTVATAEVWAGSSCRAICAFIAELSCHWPLCGRSTSSPPLPGAAWAVADRFGFAKIYWRTTMSTRILSTMPATAFIFFVSFVLYSFFSSWSSWQWSASETDHHLDNHRRHGHRYCDTCKGLSQATVRPWSAAAASDGAPVWRNLRPAGPALRLECGQDAHMSRSRYMRKGSLSGCTEIAGVVYAMLRLG